MSEVRLDELLDVLERVLLAIGEWPVSEGRMHEIRGRDFVDAPVYHLAGTEPACPTCDAIMLLRRCRYAREEV